MVTPAQRHGVFIADPAPQGARLGEPQMMSVGGSPPADQARLHRDKPKMRTVAVATWFAECECGFVDVPCHGIVDRR